MRRTALRFLGPFLVFVLVLSYGNAAVGSGSIESVGMSHRLEALVHADEVSSRVLRDRAEPLTASIVLAGLIDKLTLVYQDLSYWEDGSGGFMAGVVHRVEFGAAGPGRRTAAIPSEHIVQPGLRMHWEIEKNGQVLATPVRKVHYLDLEQMEAELSGTALSAGSRIAWDVERLGGNLPGGSVSFGSASMPHSSSVGVSSKMLELRSVEPNPHNGVDFPIDHIPVKAMASSEVFLAEEWGAAGLMVQIKHAGGPYHSRYMHLHRIDVAKGSFVEQGQQIGISGNTGISSGPHLHADFVCFVNGDRLMIYPFRWFVGNVPAYNQGLDFDFVQTPVAAWDEQLGTYISVNAYPRGGTGGLEVYLWWRHQGAGEDWSRCRMQHLQGSHLYRYHWGWSAGPVDYWVEVRRQDISSWVTRPAEFNSARPSRYYGVTVHGPVEPDPPSPPPPPPPGGGGGGGWPYPDPPPIYPYHSPQHLLPTPQ